MRDAKLVADEDGTRRCGGHTDPPGVVLWASRSGDLWARWWFCPACRRWLYEEAEVEQGTLL